MVVGLEWDTNTDEFVFRFEDLLGKCLAVEQTKQNLLSVTALIYDPLGLITPITARSKTIFQILCKDKLFGMRSFHLILQQFGITFLMN